MDNKKNINKKEMGKHEVLSKPWEKILGKKVSKGDLKRLTIDEVKEELRNKIKDKAKK
jgi:hypothetical protein